jgi:hypothetical protein
MATLKSPIITIGQYVLALHPKAFYEVDFMNVENNNVFEGFNIWLLHVIAFLVFVLNVVVINSALEMVNFSCDS